MNALFAQPVFEVAGIAYTWADVVAAADARGDWALVQQRGLENLRVLAEAENEPDIDEAAAAFRYERNLESASDAQAWLDRWGLTEDQWLDWLRAQALRQLSHASCEDDGDTDAQEAAVHAEAVCSKRLKRLAWTLAGRAAVEAGSATGAIRDSSKGTALARMETSFRDFASTVATFTAVEAQLTSHRLDWTRVTYKTLLFANRDQAQEAVLTITEDGLEIDDFAKSVGLTADRRTTLIEDADAAIADHLRGAVAGQTIGPFRDGDRWRICTVTEKTAPSLSDPVLLERARDRVVHAAVAREVSRRVRWLWPI